MHDYYGYLALITYKLKPFLVMWEIYIKLLFYDTHQLIQFNHQDTFTYAYNAYTFRRGIASETGKNYLESSAMSM